MNEAFDSIVIGTGQAGPPLAVRLAGSGRRTAIVERKRFGGTCVNVGCIPTKTLVASARAAHVVRTAAEFGIGIDGPVHVDMARVKARKDTVVAESTGNIEKWLRGTPGVTVIEGHARFESPRVVRVGDRLLEAPEIFINTGGRPTRPAIEGLDGIDYLTSSGMMDLDSFQNTCSCWAAATSDSNSRRCTGASAAASPWWKWRRDSFPARTRKCRSVRGDPCARRHQCPAECEVPARREARRRRAMHVSCEQEPREIAGSHLLLAVGRVPNTDDLGLDRAGVVTDARGFIQVDDRLATTSPASGRWEMSTAAARSRTRPTTTTKSSPRTCSTGTRGESPTAFRSMRCSPIRRLRARA